MGKVKYYLDGGQLYPSTKAEFVEGLEKLNSFTQFRFLHWNVGHWCGGSSTSSSIDASTKDRYIKAYRSIFNEHKPDVVGICEYSRVFSKDGTLTKDGILCQYPNVLEGIENEYAGCAIYGSDGFNFETPEVIDLGYSPYYAYHTHCVLGGKLLHIVELHAPWQSADANKNAMRIIVDKFKDCEHVVIGGDFNVRPDGLDAYDILRNGGFTLANTERGKAYMGDVLTQPISEYCTLTIDNILTKGVTITSTKSIVEANVLIQTPVLPQGQSVRAGGYVDESILKIKVGVDVQAEDGNKYSLSDHCPLVCDLVF